MNTMSKIKCEIENKIWKIACRNQSSLDILINLRILRLTDLQFALQNLKFKIQNTVTHSNRKPKKIKDLDFTNGKIGIQYPRRKFNRVDEMFCQLHHPPKKERKKCTLQMEKS